MSCGISSTPGSTLADMTQGEVAAKTVAAPPTSRARKRSVGLIRRLCMREASAEAEFRPLAGTGSVLLPAKAVKQYVIPAAPERAGQGEM